ncbi:hypothetical protein SDC9_211637 [bioreactor metagenome]|uniref:Amidohydrolase-related domain-containing protein n=1 Tax=bioreactor metagenome TaxID=1076179 RepID=A0A645JL83_9ZZZZ
MFDCHIHMMKDVEKKDEFFRTVEGAGVSGGVLFSLPPAAFDGNTRSASERLDKVLRLADGKENFYPFYFVDPLEEDASGQIDEAASRHFGIQDHVYRRLSQ